jgi:hypothetical protein
MVPTALALRVMKLRDLRLALLASVAAPIALLGVVAWRAGP